MSEQSIFPNLFFKLNNWPDKEIITELTKYAQSQRTNPQNAASIVHTMCTRLVDNTIPPTYRLPIFYLMDSIMKYNRDPYVPLFLQYLESIYSTVFHDIPEKDRKKIEFLLTTWEERNLIPSELLQSMRNELKNITPPVLPVTAHGFDPGHNMHSTVPDNTMWIHQQQQQNMTDQYSYVNTVQSIPSLYYASPSIQQSHNDSLFPSFDQNIYSHAVPANQYIVPSVQTIQEASNMPQNLHKRNNADVSSGNNLKRNRAVNTNDGILQIEMTKLLSQLLYDLGQPPNHFTLEQLFHENNALYNQIQEQAQSIIKSNNMSTYNNGISEVGSAVSNNTDAKDNIIYGFVSETPVVINIVHVEYLQNQINTSNFLSMLNAEALSNCRKLSLQLQHHLNSTNLSSASVSTLPKVLFGLFTYLKLCNRTTYIFISLDPLPLQPSHSFVDDTGKNAYITIDKIPLPTFNVDELLTRPDAALKALYIDRSFFAEDAQRFKNAEDFRRHTDKLITSRIEKKKKLLLGETQEERKCRSWYHANYLWIGKDSNILHEKEDCDEIISSSTHALEEVFVIPADENFVRCPLSHETFEKFFDDEEGELMYRHAVKVLVTEVANKDVYNLGKSTISENVRYLIVRKPLIVDAWLQAGTAVTLNEAIQRYQLMGRDQASIDKLIKAAGEEEDGDDIFVILEL